MAEEDSRVDKAVYSQESLSTLIIRFLRHESPAFGMDAISENVTVAHSTDNFNVEENDTTEELQERARERESICRVVFAVPVHSVHSQFLLICILCFKRRLSIKINLNCKFLSNNSFPFTLRAMIKRGKKNAP